MADGRADGMPDGHGIKASKPNSTNNILADCHVLTADGGVLAVKVVDGEITAPAATEIAGGLVEQTTGVVGYANKRYIAFEWPDGATGQVTIDGVVFQAAGAAGLPVFPMLGRNEYHRTINVDMSAGSAILVNYLDA